MAERQLTAACAQMAADLTPTSPSETWGAKPSIALRDCDYQSVDCSDREAKSAGDHFNPAMHEHGLPPGEMRHLGDLGNLAVGKEGKGHLEITIARANLSRGDKMSFIDRGIIIHKKVDNGGQPTGNAGKRIGCGEIK